MGDTRRIDVVDGLRGFALLGILVVNIGFFADGFNPSVGIANPEFDGVLDHGAHLLVTFFFETKFYLLFSFLFGYSFTLQMESAARAGARFRPRFLRRLLGLFVIGALHAVFLWYGDILLTYAVFGLFLLAMRGVKDKTALWTAGILIATVAGLLAAAGLLLPADPTSAQALQATAEQANAAYAGSPGDVMAQRLLDWAFAGPVIFFVQGPSALAAFLVGLVLGRRQALREPGRLPLGRVVAICLPIGLVGAVVFTYTTQTFGRDGWALVGLAIDLLTAPFLTAAYVALLLLAFQRGRRLLGALAPAGRVALSNYLLQSVVCCLVFTGYGFGLVGSVSPPVVLLIAAAIFAGQLVLSAWWTQRHRYGPVEWVLRALTNWSTRPSGEVAVTSRT